MKYFHRPIPYHNPTTTPPQWYYNGTTTVPEGYNKLLLSGSEKENFGKYKKASSIKNASP
ncbi:MAG TPA: hypothetical protein VL022_10125 [Moheibacter sp.]|nr:hypothetical protein [Moheibacter sp.]